MPMLYVILIHIIFKWAISTNDVHTVCMFACIYLILRVKIKGAAWGISGI